MHINIYKVILLLIFLMQSTIFANVDENVNFLEVVKNHYFMIQRLNNQYVSRVNFSDKVVRNSRLIADEIEVYHFPETVSRFRPYTMMARPLPRPIKEVELIFTNCSLDRLSEGEFYVFGNYQDNQIVITDYISCRNLKHYAKELDERYLKDFTSMENYALEVFQTKFSLKSRVIHDFCYIQSQGHSKCELGRVFNRDDKAGVKLSNNLIIPLNKILNKPKQSLINNEKVIITCNINSSEEISNTAVTSLTKFNKSFSSARYYKSNFYFDSSFRKYYNYAYINRTFKNLIQDKLWTPGAFNNKRGLSPKETCHYSGMLYLSSLATMYKNNMLKEEIREYLFWNNPKKFEWFKKNIDMLSKSGPSFPNKRTVRW